MNQRQGKPCLIFTSGQALSIDILFSPRNGKKRGTFAVGLMRCVGISKQYLGLDLNVISNESNQNLGLNVAALGMMTAEDVVIERMSTSDIPQVAEMVRRGIGAYEEAGTVLASTFRRLENLATSYDGPGSTYIVARDKRPTTLSTLALRATAAVALRDESLAELVSARFTASRRLKA